MRSENFADCRGRNAGCPAPPAQIPACATNAPGSSLGSNVNRRAVWTRSTPGAQPPIGSTQFPGAVSGLRPPNGCSPCAGPFPPRPPQRVASHCSNASSVLWPGPTSHPRTCSACGLWPSRTGPHRGAGTDEISQVPYKGRLHVHEVSDCARSDPHLPSSRMDRCCLLFNGTRSAPRNSTRFAAQYSAHGIPCERFAAGLATRTSRITRGRSRWLDVTP